MAIAHLRLDFPLGYIGYIGYIGFSGYVGYTCGSISHSAPFPSHQQLRPAWTVQCSAAGEAGGCGGLATGAVPGDGRVGGGGEGYELGKGNVGRAGGIDGRGEGMADGGVVTAAGEVFERDSSGDAKTGGGEVFWEDDIGGGNVDAAG